MLSHPRYIIPKKELNGVIGRKEQAFGFKVNALFLPYSSWNIPSNYVWKLQGTFPWEALSALKTWANPPLQYPQAAERGLVYSLTQKSWSSLK